MRTLLFLLFILNCSFLTGQATQSEKNSVTLNYAYQLGESYKYKKIVSREGEDFCSFIAIRPLETMTNGDTWYEFSLDSCTYAYNGRLIRTTKKEDLENAKIHFLYSNFGAKLKTDLLNQKRNGYIRSDDSSDDERFFELSKNPIQFGQTWNAKKSDEIDSYNTKDKNLKNVLIGIESKNGYECYRIDFSGTSADIAKRDDYTQIDNGIISGSIWIEIERKIVIAIESEVMIQNSDYKHPGLSKNSKLYKMLSSTKASSYKTTVELIE